jgi:predicted metal-dependent hydrolase
MEYNQNIQKKFTHYWVSPKKLIVRRMKSRWWSCSKAWNITLNTDLIQAPRWCIEYVLNHEYCHLIEFWHTRKFYELQKETMSDWSKWKNKLEKLLA